MTQFLNHFIQPAIIVPNMMPANGLLNNLVCHYSLEEASGTRFDSHGSNDLTVNGTVGLAAGRPGNCATFNGGSGNYLSIADNVDLSRGDFDFTVAAFCLFVTNTGTRVVACKGSSSGSQGQEFQIYHASTFKFDIGNGAGTGDTVDSSVAAVNNTFYCIRCWHDAVNNEIGIAVNESTVATKSYSAGSHNSGHEMTLGRYSNFNGGYVNGRIDSFSMWDVLLTEEQGLAYFNAGMGLAYAAYTS